MTWMKGWPVGVESTDSRSPIEKMKVMPIVRAMRALGMKDQMRALGIMREASWTSSAVGLMCQFRVGSRVRGGRTDVDDAVVAA